MSILEDTKALWTCAFLSCTFQSDHMPSAQRTVLPLCPLPADADQPNYDGNTTIMSADDFDAANNLSTTDNHPVVDETGETATAPPPRSNRITAAAKAELHRYFAAAGYKRNTRMPKHNADKGVESIIEKYELQRDQVSRQLRNWKGVNFKNSQVKMIINPDDIEASVYQGLSEDSLDG